MSQVQYLLQLGVDPNVADYDSRTAVHLAAASGVFGSSHGSSSGMMFMVRLFECYEVADGRWGSAEYVR